MHDNAPAQVARYTTACLREFGIKEPLQTKRIRSKNTPWVTSDIKNLINAQDSLKRKAVITNLETDWQNYKGLEIR